MISNSSTKRALSTPVRPPSKREAKFDTPLRIREKVKALFSGHTMHFNHQFILERFGIATPAAPPINGEDKRSVEVPQNEKEKQLGFDSKQLKEPLNPPDFPKDWDRTSGK